MSCNVSLWLDSGHRDVMGTVPDSTGAVISNANLAVSNPEKVEFVSNAPGDYAAPKLPISKYVMTVEARGPI